MTVLLVNPNASSAVTAQMVAIARGVLPGVAGHTLTGVPPMLTTPSALALAARQVAALRPAASVTGVIVAAFGDPGRAALARRLAVPVLGIGAAAARAAGAGGARFAVATTTPALRPAIDARMRRAGAGYVGCFCTQGDPVALLRDTGALDAALSDAIGRAAAAGAARVIIGGGPLADAALRLAPGAPVPLIHPVIEAARQMAAALGRAP